MSFLQGKIYTADAKLGFDDNASFRQKDIFDMEDTTESDPREVEAASFNLNYVQVVLCPLGLAAALPLAT